MNSPTDKNKILPSNHEKNSGETSANVNAPSELQAEAPAPVKIVLKVNQVPERRQRKTKTIQKTRGKKLEGIKCPYCERFFPVS